MKLIQKLNSLGINLKVVEGDLKISAPKGKLTIDLLNEIKAGKQDLVDYLSSHMINWEDEGHPLTSSQKRLWTLSQYDGGNVAYNISEVLELDGTLELDKLSEAVNRIIQRHESLRTSIKEDKNGDIKQFVLPYDKACLLIDCHDIGDKAEEEIQKILTGKLAHQFNLSEAPLVKVELLKLNKTKHILIFILHHIIADGWSVEILSREVLHIYNSLVNGSEISLPELRIQYKDFAYWIEGEAQQEVLAGSKAYWQEKLKGELPILELPSQNSRPRIKTFNGLQINYTFPSTTVQRLKEFLRKNDATLFMGLMAALNGLFYRYSGQTDIILGTPVAGRVHKDLEGQIGLYLNTLAIRSSFDSKDTFKQLVRKQKELLLEAYSHQSYPFDELIEELDISRDPSRSALFDVMVIFQNQKDIFETKDSMSGIQISNFKNIQRNKSHFDLSFYFAERDGCLDVILEYNPDIYSSNFSERILRHLECFITEALLNPNYSIAKVNYVLPEKRKVLLNRHSNANFYKDNNKTLIDLIESQCKKTPHKTALVYDYKSFTYKEVQEKSNQMAQYLLKHYLVKPEDLITVKVERNEWLIIILLAILKTGAAYVPIDPNYPNERIAYLEKDCKSRITITDSILNDFKNYPGLSKRLPRVAISLKSLAYVIYTSGSTGEPKGVMLTHSNVVAFINWCVEEFVEDTFEIIYAATSQCFDLSVFEMFYPLIVGKKIRVITNGMYIKDYLEIDTKVLINTVPSVVDNLLKQGASFDNIVAINMAGEPIPKSLANTLLEYNIPLRNLYGPSEDTTYSTCYHIRKIHEQSLPIGKPIANTQIFILSEEQSLEDDGIVGEICITGACLSPGYLRKEELTREKFIPNPYFPDTLIYRTGDLGFWMSDGNLGFIGRKDNQIKLRGYRIELEEIENALLKEPSIEQVVVLIKEIAGEKHIVAYLVGKGIEIGRIRQHLFTKLVSYMIPSYYLILDVIPLTPNGKLDKKRLLDMDVIKINPTTYVAAQNEIEKGLVLIWEDILGVSPIGIIDNFFALGGHSLHITRMLYKMNKDFKVNLHMQNVFAAQNIQELSKLIEEETLFNEGIGAYQPENFKSNKTSKIWEI